MIQSFKHKGLKRLFETGSRSKIQSNHAEKLRRQLAILNRAASPQDMAMPGWQLHPLSGELAGCWSVSVSGNWRLIFEIENGHAVRVDYQDYH